MRESDALLFHEGPGTGGGIRRLDIGDRPLGVAVDGIELDVQLTKDGEVVIIHDEYLDDLTDFTGNVRDYTLGELKSCNAGGKWQEVYGFQPIPTFEEYCEWASCNSLITNVEIKSSVYYYEELEKKTMELFSAVIFLLWKDTGMCGE